MLLEEVRSGAEFGRTSVASDAERLGPPLLGLLLILHITVSVLDEGCSGGCVALGGIRAGGGFLTGTPGVAPNRMAAP